MIQYINKEKVSSEITKRIKHNEMVMDHNTEITELLSRELNTLYELSSFINFLEVKEVSDIWYDARKTLPEDGIEQIICIKEDGLAVSSVGKIVNGTTKWAYLNDLLNISNV